MATTSVLARARVLYHHVGVDKSIRHAVRVAAALPRNVRAEDCEPTEDYDGAVLPGWYADDGQCEVHFPRASDGLEAAEEYVDGGDWGDACAVDVCVWRKALIYDGEEVVDACVDEESHSVDVEVNHESAIHDVMGSDGCGDDPEDHDWTSEGEGGCDTNPGVWSLGGTAISVSSHCSVCGLHRTTIHRGSQRNPGESSTSVTYEAPDADWEAAAAR